MPYDLCFSFILFYEEKSNFYATAWWTYILSSNSVKNTVVQSNFEIEEDVSHKQYNCSKILHNIKKKMRNEMKHLQFQFVLYHNCIFKL